MEGDGWKEMAGRREMTGTREVAGRKEMCERMEMAGRMLKMFLQVREVRELKQAPVAPGCGEGCADPNAIDD